MASLDFFKNYIEDLKKSRSTSKSKVQEVRLPPALLDKKKYDRLSTEEKRSFRTLISSKKHTINKQDLDKIVENANPHILNYLSQRDDLSPVHALKIAKHVPEMSFRRDVPYSRHTEFRQNIFDRAIKKLDQSQLVKLATDKHFKWNIHVIHKLDPSSLLSIFDPRHDIDSKIAREALKHNASSDAHLDAALQHPNPDIGYTAVHSRHFREEHLPRALTHTNPRIREAGYERALKDFGRGVPVVMSGLNDQDENVRVAVANAMPSNEETIRQIVPQILDNPEALEEILSRDNSWDRRGKDSYFDEDQLSHILQTHANNKRVMDQIDVKKHITNPDLAELAYNAEGFRTNRNEFSNLLSNPHVGPHILHDYIDKLQAPQELPWYYGDAYDFTRPISQILENPNIDNTHIEKILGKVNELAGVGHHYNDYGAHQWRSSLADIKAKAAAHPMAGAAAAQIDFDDPKVQYRLAQRGQNISDEIKAKLAESPHDKVREALIYNHTLPMPLLDKLTKDKSAKTRYLAFQRIYRQHQKDDTPIPDDIVKRGLIDKSSKVRDIAFRQNISADHLNFAMNSKHAATRAQALRHNNATPEMFKKAAIKDKSKEVMKAILDKGAQHLDENESAVMFARAPEDLQADMMRHHTFKIPSNVIDRVIENGDTRAIESLARHKKDLSEDDIRKLYNAGTKYVKETLLEKGNMPVDLLELAAYSPNKEIVAAAAGNERLPSSHIDHLIKVDDINTKIALARRKDLKPDHFESLLASDDLPILRNVLANHKIPAHMLQNAFNAERIWNDPQLVTEALNNAQATDAMFDKAMTHPSSRVQRIAKENVSLLRPDMYNKSLEGGHEIHISPLTEKLKHLKGLIEEHPDRKVHKRDLEKKGHQNLPVQILDPKGHVTPESIDSFIGATPKDRYNISYGEWKGAQRHDESVTQKVLQVNLTNEHVQKLRDMGLWDTFRKIHDMSKRSGHPVDNHTLGWARIDDSHPGHWHIDEIQSDLGRGTIQAIENAARSGQMSEQDATKYKGELKTMIKVLSGQHKNINHAIFGAVHESARQKGIKTTSMDELYDQAKQSWQSTDRDLPVHMKETYQEFPSKVGYEMKPKKEHMPNTQSKESQFQFRKLVKSLNELREMVSDFAYYELLEKSEQLVQKFESMTAGRHVQGGQAKQKAQPVPKDKVPPNRPHIRADTQTEVNLKYENSVKKKFSERLEKQISKAKDVIFQALDKSKGRLIVYHGSDTLPPGKTPDKSDSAGVFVTPDESFAYQFGDTVHKFSIDHSRIFDTRNPDHRKLIEGKVPLSPAGLPHAMGASTDPKDLETLRTIAIKHGFVGSYQHESEWEGKKIGIEVYDPSHLKEEKDLQKAFQYKGTIFPEASDPDGMEHPAGKPYVKVTSPNHGAAWAYHPNVVNKMVDQFKEHYNRVVPHMSPRGGRLMANLGRMLAKDPDAHVIPTGMKNGEEKYRFRHMLWAMQGKPGYKITEEPHGLTLHAERHSGRSDKPVEIHTWHFNEKGLKFLDKKPISNISGGDNEQRIRKSNRRTEENSRRVPEPSGRRDGSGRGPSLDGSPEGLKIVGRKNGLKKANKIPGGLADDKKPSDFNPGQIKEGAKTELEHTKDKGIAQEIAMDHLAEDPKYYDKLKTIHDDLEKGARGDWEKEGYTFDHEIVPDEYDKNAKVMIVKAKSPEGRQVATIPISFGWEETGKLLNPDDTHVHPDHRRKGIATAAYKYAEKMLGGRIIRAYVQSEDARALWNQPNRPFGNKEKKLAKSHPLAKSIPAGYLYVAMDGDDAGGQVEKAALQDNVEAIRDISERIRQGSETVRKLAETKLGAKTIVHGGDDLGFLIEARYLEFVENLRAIYKATSGFSITAGVGWNIPQATEALLYGKAHGKDQVVFYNDDVGEFIKQLKSQHISPEQKIIDSGVLSKSEEVTSSKIPSVSSVAIVAGNKILMGKRNDSGRWTLPGGHSEEGETPDQAAARELFEETAIKAKDLQKLGDEEIICEDGKKRHIHSYVMVGKPKASGRLDPDGEVTKWYWIDVSKGLPKEIENNLHSKKNVTLKLLGLQEF